MSRTGYTDALLGAVEIGTGTQEASGNNSNPTQALAYIETDYPGEWCVKVAPVTPQQGGGGPLLPSGILSIIEGAAGSRVQRAIAYGALGAAIGCRGSNISVTIVASSGGTGQVGATISQGVPTPRWTVVQRQVLPASAGTDVQLPQFTTRASVSLSGAPATALTLRQEDSQGLNLFQITVTAGQTVEFSLAPQCTRLGIVNADAVNPCTVIVGALVNE
jgi:hypothetical protein